MLKLTDKLNEEPYIFSNGYQIRFNEEPCPHTNLGYIIPEWVEQDPTLADIKRMCGSHAALPTTTIILPLKSDKIKAVKQQLSSIQPEVLLFLSKVKQFSVKEVNKDPSLNTVNAISISSEINFVTRKNIDACLYGICGILDYESSALSTIADVVAAMSSEASKADVGVLNLMDPGDGLSVKDEVGVASDLKVLLNGSKLVGKVEVDAVSEIPNIHGSLREVVRMVLVIALSSITKILG